MKEILKCHGKSKGIIKFLQLVFIQILKSVKNDHICRLFKFCHQGIRLLHPCLTGIYRIDTVIFDRLKRII